MFDVCFVGLFVFWRDTYNRKKSVSIILKVKMNFSLQNLWNSVRSKWDIYTPVHCQLHHYHIFYIMRKQETIHFTTFSTHNWKKVLLMFSDCLIGNFSQLVVTCHVRLCIVINHSPSLYDYRKHKLTFQIINHWWYNVSLFSQNTARIVNKKVKNKIK